MDIIQRAIDYAKYHHDKQVRKYNGLPYFVHLEEVASLYGALCDVDESRIAVCYLHDIVEDTSVTICDLQNNFGGEIAEGVRALTDIPDQSKNRTTRKAETRARLAASPSYIQNIKLCDMLSNAPSICRYDPSFALVFMKEMFDMSRSLIGSNEEIQDLVGKYIHAWQEKD